MNVGHLSRLLTYCPRDSKAPATAFFLTVAALIFLNNDSTWNDPVFELILFSRGSF